MKFQLTINADFNRDALHSDKTSGVYEDIPFNATITFDADNIGDAREIAEGFLPKSIHSRISVAGLYWKKPESTAPGKVSTTRISRFPTPYHQGSYLYSYHIELKPIDAGPEEDDPIGMDY